MGAVYWLLPYNTGQLLKHASVTRLDIALDIYGLQRDDVLVRVPNKQLHTQISRSGALETEYFGTAASNQVVVYDKAAETKTTDDGPWTRIEIRGKNPNLYLEQLASAKNYLELCEVMRWPSDNKLAGGWLPVIRDSVAQRGLSGAIARIPETHLKEFKVIVANAERIYDPVELWKAWPSAIKSCGILDGIAIHEDSGSNPFLDEIHDQVSSKADQTTKLFEAPIEPCACPSCLKAKSEGPQTSTVATAEISDLPAAA